MAVIGGEGMPKGTELAGDSARHVQISMDAWYGMGRGFFFS